MRKAFINNKKDWCITYIFMFLISYEIVISFKQPINNFMMKFAADKLTYLNIPWNYGGLMLVIWVLTIGTMFAAVIMKINKKKIFEVFILGICLSVVVLCSFRMHTLLIVHTADNCTPESGNILMISQGDDDSDININLKQGSSELEKLKNLCYSLKPLPRNMQKEMQVKENNIDYENENTIWVTFKKSYGQNYNMIVNVYNNIIYIQRNNLDKIYYEDNGLIDYIEQIKIEYSNKN